MSIQYNSSIPGTSCVNDHGLPERYSPIPTSTPNGIAGVPSSIRMLANESGGGIFANTCSWLTNLFSRICQLLSQFFSSDATTRNLLERVISRANQIIDRHFSCGFIVNSANQQNSAIITIFKVNGQMKMSCGMTSSERGNIDGIKNLLRQLVTEADINDDRRIDIETHMIKKNSDNTWSYFHQDSNFCPLSSRFYPLNSQSGGGSGSFTGGLSIILPTLQNAISNDRAAGARIGDVIRQLQSSA